MKKIERPDLLIVGAGPVGCVIAERAAAVKKWKSLIIDKRNHVAGNCYDEVNNKGIRVHKYGPHYMRFKTFFDGSKIINAFNVFFGLNFRKSQRIIWL